MLLCVRVPVRVRLRTLDLHQPFHTCIVFKVMELQGNHTPFDSLPPSTFPYLHCLQVMELQGNIRVFCRVRPFMEMDAKAGDRPSEISCLTSGDRPKIQVPLSLSLSLSRARSHPLPPPFPPPTHTHTGTAAGQGRRQEARGGEQRARVRQRLYARHVPGGHFLRNFAPVAERDGWLQALHLRLWADRLRKDAHNAGMERLM